MPTLSERVRLAISAESDDFFNDTNDIVEGLNKAQDSIVSFCIAREKNTEKSLRALDALRDISTVTISGSTAQGSYYVSDIDVPSGREYLSLFYEDTTPLKELSATKLHQLQFSNAIPTATESYYYIVQVSDTVSFRLYLYEDGDTNDVQVHYIQSPTAIGVSDETLTELPDQLENAVVYGAVVQLSLKEQNEITQLYREWYNQELNNIY